MANETMTEPPILQGPMINWAVPIVALFATLAGTLCGVVYKEAKQISECRSQLVKSVSTRDANSDGLVDVIIENNSGNRITYFNTGTEYLTQEQIRDREIHKIEQAYQQQLKDANEFYQRAYQDVNETNRGSE